MVNPERNEQALTAAACRAGRALLRIGVRDLAQEAGVSAETVTLFENGRPARAATRTALAAAFARLGVELLNGYAPGARLRKPEAEEG